MVEPKHNTIHNSNTCQWGVEGPLSIPGNLVGWDGRAKT